MLSEKHPVVHCEETCAPIGAKPFNGPLHKGRKEITACIGKPLLQGRIADFSGVLVRGVEKHNVLAFFWGKARQMAFWVEGTQRIF